MIIINIITITDLFSNRPNTRKNFGAYIFEKLKQNQIKLEEEENRGLGRDQEILLKVCGIVLA